MTLPARREDETPHVTDLDADTLAKLVADGDCKRLTAEQRVAYYRVRCEAAGLDYRTQPFEFMNLNGKLVLYARKEASAQLNRKHQLSHEVLREAVEQDVYSVWARAKGPDGRFTDELGAVSVKGLGGENLCNAKMKAVTKAKRRATLSYCGLGELDESELETIPARAFTGGDGGAPPALVPPRRKSEQVNASETTMRPCPKCRALNEVSHACCQSCGEDITGPLLPPDPASIEIAGEPTTDRFLKRPEWTSLVEIAKRHGKTSAMLRLYLKNTHNILDEKTVPFSLLEELTAWCGVKAEEA